MCADQSDPEGAIGTLAPPDERLVLLLRTSSAHALANIANAITAATSLTVFMPVPLRSTARRNAIGVQRYVISLDRSPKECQTSIRWYHLV
jgi:hypothetical protein